MLEDLNSGPPIKFFVELEKVAVDILLLLEDTVEDPAFENVICRNKQLWDKVLGVEQ